MDTQGDLFIAEAGSNRVRKVSGGVVTTVAGNGTKAPAAMVEVRPMRSLRNLKKSGWDPVGSVCSAGMSPHESALVKEQ